MPPQVIPVQSRLMFRAFGLSSLSTALYYVFSFLRAVIVARILTPDAFGLFGIALIASGALQVLSDFNFKAVLIARTGHDASGERDWLDTLWTLELARCCGVAAALALSAGPVATFFNEPDARPLILVVAAATAVGGLLNTRVHLFERNMQFGRAVVLEVASAAAGLATAVLVGLWLRTAVALAWAVMANAATGVLISYALVPQRPTIRIDPPSARQAFSVGGSLFLIGVLTYLTTQFDNIVIGRLLGPATLGVYLVAYSLAMLPMSVVGAVIGRVMLPDYVRRVQAGREDALAYWARSMRASAWLLVALTLPLCLSSEDIVGRLYGERWLPAASVLGVLSIAGLLRGVTRACSPMLLALGRQDLDAKAKAAETAVFVVLVLLLVGHYGMGMRGAAWAGLVCYVMAAALRVSSVARESRAARRILVGGLWRISAAVLAASALGAAVEAATGQGLLVAAVGGAVPLVAGWLSEPHLRAFLGAAGHGEHRAREGEA